MLNLPFIALGKLISKTSQTLGRGNGSTWPGHIALKGNRNFIKDIILSSSTKIIIVAGTNGKTTTSGLIRTGLEKAGKTVIQNASGANLLNGVASAILLNTNALGKLTQDFAIFEVDENALQHVLNQVTPDYLVLLNLFRDQLDRYGEINTIAQKWQDAIKKLPDKTKLILNADDPQIAYLGMNVHEQKKSLYFSLIDKNFSSKKDHTADSVFCPKCGNKLIFETITFSHLGKWRCSTCGLKQPTPAISEYPIYPLSGTYNKYNIIASALVLEDAGLDKKEIKNSFEKFTPAFGRQEIIHYQGKKMQLFLSKNPTSFNQSFATIQELHGKFLLLILNDRIPDGKDISWIWDTELEGAERFTKIFLAGDRVYDLALRLKYELGTTEYEKKVNIFNTLSEAVSMSSAMIASEETLYILPTYSAMLDTRKILTGKKIL
jgi:UDP-N-acetylmuramyl tripeptide synthase